MPQCMSERRVFFSSPNERSQNLFVDNFSGHIETEAMKYAEESIRFDVI